METITTRSLIQAVILTHCLTIKQCSHQYPQSSASRTEVDPSPVGSLFVATLLAGAGVQDSRSGSANDDGRGTTWEASFINLPSAGGPFLWYIHSSPVPANGDCAGTSGHLDPLVSVMFATVCNPSSPANCQIGDLSGKFGKITASALSLSFDDLFFSTDLTNAAFVGSQVRLSIHTADNKRIACADSVAEAGEGMGR
ncbi:hypothetical protein F5882DRAFT_308461 [Hyaloscypha sp. PMI_1271]|nr:hypothetical protein F5882DRAFT_308461 [Hyaloscypha sp. PMI_1271]